MLVQRNRKPTQTVKSSRVQPKKNMSVSRFRPRHFYFLAFVCFLLLWNLQSGSDSVKQPISNVFQTGKLRANRKDGFWFGPDVPSFNAHGEVSEANHLIMVAGHSVTISHHLYDAGTDEKDWYLFDYQRHKGLPQTIAAHLRAAIKLSSYDPKALLIFSGGETRPQTGPVNEGTSYFQVADAMGLWTENDAPYSHTVRSRTTTEEFATDSFQNLMFSICRFYEVTGRYPEKISVISFAFKETRFKELHSKALLWPDEKFNYIGVDPDASTGFDVEEATRGEIENSVKYFEKDLYGCHSEFLQQKRLQRNPFHRTPPYELSCPDMKELFHWCEENLIPADKVPW